MLLCSSKPWEELHIVHHVPTYGTQFWQGEIMMDTDLQFDEKYFDGIHMYSIIFLWLNHKQNYV